MRMVRRWSGLWSVGLALGFAVIAGPSASATPLITYSTSGGIDGTGITGTPVISFLSLSGANAQFNSPSYFSIGEFQVSPLPAGTSTTYSNTPFHLSFSVTDVNGSAPTPNETPINLTGVLNGKITGTNQSTVTATIDPIWNHTFQTGNYLNTLTIPSQTVMLVPSTTNSGITTLQAQLTSTSTVVPVPEPASLSIFVAALGGFGAWSRIRSARRSG